METPRLWLLRLLKREAGVCCRILKSPSLSRVVLQPYTSVLAQWHHVNLKEISCGIESARAVLAGENTKLSGNLLIFLNALLSLSNVWNFFAAKLCVMRNGSVIWEVKETAPKNLLGESEKSEM